MPKIKLTFDFPPVAQARPRADQIRFHKMLTKRRIIHGIARSVDDALKIIDEELIGYGFKNYGGEIMTKKEILSELINRVLTGEYELWEVRRSNKDGLQEYDFVIKKASQQRDQ